jgi:KipI family sensor histidine kinase inhibitor
VKAFPFGRQAFFVDLEIDDHPDRAARTRAAGDAIRGRSTIRDVAFGAGTLLLDGVHAWTDLMPVLQQGARAARRPPRRSLDAPVHTLPVVYDGLDLGELGRLLGMEVPEIIRLHSGATYTADLLGFLPGFAYLGPVEGPLALPRRGTPRAAVPARSVAVAAGFTGIYPSVSPGGWHLLGRAPTFRPFDPATGAPALTPGSRVRFVPAEAGDLPAEIEERREPEVTGKALRVVAAPACATVQDQGRRGLLHLGLPRSGPLDPVAWLASNLALGNASNRAAVEIPQGSLEVEARGAMQVSLDGEAPIRLADGERLRVPSGERAVRYLAVEGGIAAPLLLGSRATLPSARLGGLGGRPLRRGDLLPVAGGQEREPSPLRLRTTPELPALLSLIPGPHQEHFDQEALELLLREQFTVSRLGDRVGVRLEGPRLPVHGRLRFPAPMLRGAIEVTPDGTPIVLGPDHPVTGGYPVLGVLTRGAQARLARLWPGQPVRFTMA